jgi:hypothetical protein
MSMSGKQATIAGLKALGWTQDFTARTTKFQVFTHVNSKYLFLIGSGGAFRRVDKGQPIASSFSLTDGAKHKALQQLGRISEGLTREQATDAFRSFYAGSQPVRSAFQQPVYADDTSVESNPC